MKHAPDDDDPVTTTDALSDRELVALLAGEDVVLPDGSSLAELADLSLPELQARGVGRDAARRLLASFELGRRSRVGRPLPRALHAPEDAYACVEALIDDAEREHFVVVVLDVRNRPRRVAHVAQGSVNRCLVDPRDVFAPAIRERGTAVLIAHNHPSGDPTPSPEDVELTRRLVQAGQLLGMPVLDHLIVGSGPHVRKSKRFVSLAELGVLGVGHIVGDADIASAGDGARRRRTRKSDSARKKKATGQRRKRQR